MFYSQPTPEISRDGKKIHIVFYNLNLLVYSNPTIRYSAPYTFTTSGMLYKAGARTYGDLNNMSDEDERNTIIIELSKLSSDSVSALQGRNTDTLIAQYAINILLRETRIRTIAGLKTTSLENQRNTLIIEN